MLSFKSSVSKVITSLFLPLSLITISKLRKSHILIRSSTETALCLNLLFIACLEDIPNGSCRALCFLFL
nr:MAG TPA: hypothetical protein [Caudoviricetes sp.]